jgi:type II secretory pathway component GspD/PulD (secretin)
MNRTQGAGFEHKAAGADTNVRASALFLNFRNAPLRSVLKYFHDAAGMPIEVEPNVEIERLIEVWNDQPVTKEEAIRLLEQALDRQGYMAINKHGRLTIIPHQDAKKHYIPLPKLACQSFAG